MKKVSNYKTMKGVGKNIGTGALVGALVPLHLLYAVPTLIRKGLEYNGETWKDAPEAIINSIGGVLLASIASSIIFDSFSDNRLGYMGFGLSLATNAASGIYEIYKHTKNEMQEKLEKTSGEKLEDCVINS